MILVQVLGIAITGSTDVYVGDVLDKPNYPDPTLCVGENQSNVLRTQPPMTFALNSLPSLRFGCGSNMQGENTSSEEPPSYQHSYIVPLSCPTPLQITYRGQGVHQKK